MNNAEFIQTATTALELKRQEDISPDVRNEINQLLTALYGFQLYPEDIEAFREELQERIGAVMTGVKHEKRVDLEDIDL